MTWKLEGYDTFADEPYPLGDLHVENGVSRIDGLRPSYPDRESALAGARKRLADLERTQPASGSGGQAPAGIQDRVYIVHPDGRRERVMP
jgi:hypothetical protein